MPDTVTPPAFPAINEPRQWQRMMEMGALGGFTDAAGHCGVNRAALTQNDRKARRLLISWAEKLGLAASVDRIGNLFLRHEGTEPGLPPVLTGSHMDSQPSGGRFDGIWGVIAGLEAVQALREAGIATRRAIEVVAWTNEEGGRFAPGCMGSMAFAGHAKPDTWDASLDKDAIPFGEALAEHLASESDLARRPLGLVPHAYVEAHIEQGPSLEAQDADIGIVTGIQGSRWFLVEITGKSDHAGTTPRGLRRDAVQDMLRAITALNALMHDPTDTLRFTIGSIEVLPGSSNSVAGVARFTIDLRHPDAAVLRARGNAIEGVVQAALTLCRARVDERFHAAPIHFASLVPDAVEGAARAQGLRALRMPSGAAHDAQFLHALCPTGMIFVPSRGGVSHHPAEYTEPAELAAGTRVLAHVLLELANS